MNKNYMQNEKIYELKEICLQNHTVSIDIIDSKNYELNKVIDTVISCLKIVNKRKYDNPDYNQVNIKYSI